MRRDAMTSSSIGSKIITILLVIGALTGFCLLAYPVVSDIYASYENKENISKFSSTVSLLDETEMNAVHDQAASYNARLAGVTPPVSDIMPYDEQLLYPSTGNDGIMAWVDIPKINVSLPVYHGTDNETLSFGIGHLSSSSLPVGGASTHCVLTAHSGMTSASMFDGIRKLSAGDIFSLHVLGGELVYEVQNSEVVWPDEMDSLAIVPGLDQVTLMTCTPYGVNDHRLLVHALRTDKAAPQETIVDDAVQSVSGRTMPFAIASAIMLAVLLGLIVSAIRSRKRDDVERGQR